MQIAGLQKTTLIDYPGKVAATVFTRGCSFRCPFCHNPELVLPEKFIPLFPEKEILDFLETRIGKLQAVCITGGEPIIQTDLAEFIHKIKEMGFLVKLDTNGYNPKRLKRIISEQLVDYVAMDIKTSLEKYPIAINGRNLLRYLDGEKLQSDYPQLKMNIKESISVIMNSGIDYEFRTTVCHPIHTVSDFEEIGKIIKGAKRYFIQNFKKSKHIDEYQKFKPFSDEELEVAKRIIEKYVLKVFIR